MKLGIDNNFIDLYEICAIKSNISIKRHKYVKIPEIRENMRY